MEGVEGRGLTKGNLPERNASRTQSRSGAPSAIERIRQAARGNSKQRFTALLHHVYDVERLRAANKAIRRGAAPGIDGETWQHYGENLEGNLRDLAASLKRGAYRAKPELSPAIVGFLPIGFGDLTRLSEPGLGTEAAQ